MTWKAVTTGNYGAIDLWLERQLRGVWHSRPRRYRAQRRSRELGVEPVMFEAGGLERAVLLQRLPEIMSEGRMRSAAQDQAAEPSATRASTSACSRRTATACGRARSICFALEPNPVGPARVTSVAVEDGDQAFVGLDLSSSPVRISVVGSAGLEAVDQGQVGEGGALRQDGVGAVEHDGLGRHAARRHLAQHPGRGDAALGRHQHQDLSDVALAVELVGGAREGALDAVEIVAGGEVVVAPPAPCR